ncbi:MAG: EAL domain-containing protein [Planctomycetes bacterium]|nr:EAL domain-containing protein [Planctomycetota bacterium]
MNPPVSDAPFELVPPVSTGDAWRRWIDRDFDGVCALDSEGRIVEANLALARLFGVKREDLVGRLLGVPLFGVDPIELVVRVHSGELATVELHLLGRDAPHTWIKLRDITGWVRTRDELQRSREHYELVSRAANDGLWHWDLESDRATFSPRWKEILGHGERDLDESVGEWLDRVHPEDKERVHSALRAHIEGLTSHFENEHRLKHESGSYRWVLCRGLAVRDENGKSSHFAGSLTDVTHRKVAEEQLAHRAFYDPLTNLPNRALFLDRLRHALRRAARRKDYLFAVLFLDIDRFKVINDSLGHMAGDRLLVMIARRLELSLRPGDSVARLGGDEFTVLLDDIKDVADATKVAERIHAELVAPFNIGGQELFTSASIGIACSNTGYSRPEDVLRDADTAMYRAKARGRARHALFDTAMHAHAVRQLQIEADLRRAVERNEMRVFYQPIVSLETGRISGFEALARWTHPERGAVPPNEFIVIAEETGLIVQLGRWVLREACLQFADWRRRLGVSEPCLMSVNVSSKQLSQPDLATQIAQVLEETEVPGSALQLEITESAILEHPESAKAVLERLKELGLRLSIDDFGTGYSSLSYLQRFPIDALKIDRSFIQHLGVDKAIDGEDARIASTIVMIGRNLGLDVVAEGVETQAQLELLRTFRCDYAQGFHFSRAVDGDAARDLLSVARRW